MPKNIIFCADGTWNGPEKETGVSAVDGSDHQGELSAGAVTNVVKLFANLPGNVTAETLNLRNEQEKMHKASDGAELQVMKYLHGVGDTSNRLARILGGAFGMGVIARVVRGYTFISRHYNAGDAIHVIGFSRGAYTARALAGMIAGVGLLNPATYDPADSDAAYALGISAWRKFREDSLRNANRLTGIANTLLNFVQAFASRPLPPGGLIPDIPIKAVAVWDTVGSLGVPLYAGNARLDVFRFADCGLSSKVEYGFHAMAIDELRADFPVTRWDARDNIEQVWLNGAHADVGGGYPANESLLSNIALSWMMNKLAGVGVIFTRPLSHAIGPQDVGQAIHTPWNEPPFRLLARAPRQVLPTDVVHASVLQRYNKGGSASAGLAGLNAAQIAALRQDPALYTAT